LATQFLLISGQVDRVFTAAVTFKFPAMMDIHRIFENNRQWVADKLQLDPDYFHKLASGQQPEYLYIGCADSRVTAEDLMGLQPGEVFIHRNVANLVVSTDSNLNAVVQFAVEHLKVRHIIVCGHYECGGVKAALYPSDMGQLNSWLQTLRDVYRYHQAELDQIADEHRRFDRLVELNVYEQCINIVKIDHIQKSWYATGYPRIHGWVFDVRTGLIKDMKINIEKEFASIRSIYDLHPAIGSAANQRPR
jgi:carbonic anhydrase